MSCQGHLHVFTFMHLKIYWDNIKTWRQVNVVEKVYMLICTQTSSTKQQDIRRVNVLYVDIHCNIINVRKVFWRNYVIMSENARSSYLLKYFTFAISYNVFFSYNLFKIWHYIFTAIVLSSILFFTIESHEQSKIVK